MSQSNNIIFVKKTKKIQNDQRYKGSWKVAYADFVTAMMAFFLLLWLVSVSSESTLQGVAQYFTQTDSASDKAGLGFHGGTEANITEGFNTQNAASNSLIYGSPTKGHKIEIEKKTSNMSEIEMDHFINIMNNIKQNNEIKNYSDNLQINITNEGLLIQITDSNNRPIFNPNSSKIQPYMEKILKVIGNIISKQPNYISISGHTASVKSNNFGNNNDLDPWKISFERANEVRKFMTNIINKKQVVKIIGMADREPIDNRNPNSVKNIRVDITLLNDSSISNYQKSIPDAAIRLN